MCKSMYNRLEKRHGNCGPRGFTLIEILIVVIILGIISAIVIPQFSNASHQSREVTLRDCLRYLRQQTAIYKAQHRDVPPGYPSGDTTQTPDQASFLSQMINYTDEHGNVVLPSAPATFGPYLSQMPGNPLN